MILLVTMKCQNHKVLRREDVELDYAGQISGIQTKLMPLSTPDDADINKLGIT